MKIKKKFKKKLKKELPKRGIIIVHDAFFLLIFWHL